MPPAHRPSAVQKSGSWVFAVKNFCRRRFGRFFLAQNEVGRDHRYRFSDFQTPLGFRAGKNRQGPLKKHPRVSCFMEFSQNTRASFTVLWRSDWDRVPTKHPRVSCFMEFSQNTRECFYRPCPDVPKWAFAYIPFA